MIFDYIDIFHGSLLVTCNVSLVMSAPVHMQMQFGIQILIKMLLKGLTLNPIRGGYSILVKKLKIKLCLC